VTLTDAEIAGILAPAGLHLVERVGGEVPLPPLPKNVGPASAGPEHGRFDSEADEFVDVRAADFADKANAGWHRMAAEYGLFDDSREFLLCLGLARLGEEPVQPPWSLWFRVRLLDGWDLVRSEVDLQRSSFGALFSERYVPEFTMASLDGRMMLSTTVWGDGTLSTIVIRP
jgi:hypothetical protein